MSSTTMQVEGSTCIVTGADPASAGRSRRSSLLPARGLSSVISTPWPRTKRPTGSLRADRSRWPGMRTPVPPPESAPLSIWRTRRFGPVDIYVANAGVHGPPGLGTGEGDWDRAIAVNLIAHVRAAALLVPGWISSGHGYFVSVASAAGLLTHIGGAAYAATKHAAVGFAEWLAITYGDQGIGVSCVCPMGVDTELLGSTRQSSDATEQLAARSIMNAAEVISPERVAQVDRRCLPQRRFPGVTASRSAG